MSQPEMGFNMQKMSGASQKKKKPQKKCLKKETMSGASQK